jgi:DNA-binding PadR family transcriptional regulator
LSTELAETDYWEMLINRSASRLFLLAALSERPMPGYELARAIREACGGCCEPPDAMIYPTSHDLMKGGYLQCEVETQGGRQRKVCRLTEKGQEAFRAAAEAWGRFLPHIEEAIASGLKVAEGAGSEEE